MQRVGDTLASAPSFTARRSAASNLPNFELPPPPLAALHSKYQPYANSHNDNQGAAPSGSVASVGNLLTPPNTMPGDSISPTSAAPHPTGQTSSNSYTSSGYWSQSTPNQYGYSSGTTPQWIPPRGLFSPNSLNSIVRSTSSGNNEMPTPSNYELHQLPPFPSSISSSSLPTMASQQQAMNAAMMNSHSSSSGMNGRPPPTPTYFPHNNSSSTPNHTSYPYSTAPSSNQPNPGNMNITQQITPANSSDSIPTLNHMNSTGANSQYQRAFGSYPLPAMTGSMMHAMPGVNGQLPLVGGLSGPMMPAYGGLQAMYGTHQQTSAHPNALNDRPFKCDQCVQSFNRNHDLKRHKRIHLAVKPFPCGHCDKSFSRKDALKRHILVKGCDKVNKAANRHNSDSASPDSIKTEARTGGISPDESPPHPRA